LSFNCASSSPLTPTSTEGGVTEARENEEDDDDDEEEDENEGREIGWVGDGNIILEAPA